MRRTWFAHPKAMICQLRNCAPNACQKGGQPFSLLKDYATAVALI